MPKPVRISVIGAGSATFSLGLVKDLCLTENLSGSHVTFMDVDTDRLNAVTAMATRFTAELGSDLSFEETTSREDSLKDVDFVINTAAAQSHYHQVDMRKVCQARLLLPGTRIRQLLQFQPDARRGPRYGTNLSRCVAHSIRQSRLRRLYAYDA